MKNFNIIVAAFAASAVLLTGCATSRADDHEDGWDDGSGHVSPGTAAAMAKPATSESVSEGHGGVGAAGGRASGAVS